jgi:maleate isomerase
VEHELWRIVFDNRAALDGVGLHTTPVATPRPVLRSEADLAAYKRQFIDGLAVAVDQAMLAQPEHLVMGMSLEHILHGIGPIRAVMADVEARSGAPWATWHDAAPAALTRLGARRIGLLTPFDRVGNENARRMFEDLGFEVVSSVGFACANALHIAHIPDEAKERAITELLATRANRLDAVVQCGTNMSLVDVTERLEPRLGIPILGINAVTFWYALRESGIRAPLVGAGRLLREH